MDSDNYEVICCEDDVEYRIYCDTCDKLCIDKFLKNHVKSGTHVYIIHKRQQLYK